MSDVNTTLARANALLITTADAALAEHYPATLRETLLAISGLLVEAMDLPSAVAM